MSEEIPAVKIVNQELACQAYEQELMSRAKILRVLYHNDDVIAKSLEGKIIKKFYCDSDKLLLLTDDNLLVHIIPEVHGEDEASLDQGILWCSDLQTLGLVTEEELTKLEELQKAANRNYWKLRAISEMNRLKKEYPDEFKKVSESEANTASQS